MRSRIENLIAQTAVAVGQQEAALQRGLRGRAMYEHKRPMGLFNLNRAQMYSEGLGQIRSSEAQIFDPGMGVIQPSGAEIFSNIEDCGCGCQNPGLSNVPQAGQENGQERPWWFWLAVGAGVGGFLYLAKRGMSRNPEDPSDVEASQQAAAIAVQAGLPTILWGEPGIGKTSWLEALGRVMDAKVFTVIGSTKDPADIGGMMDREGRLIAPRWAQEIAERSINGERSVLFLDEFSSMSPLVHAAMLRVVNEKVAGDLNFDPKRYPKYYPGPADPRTGKRRKVKASLVGKATPFSGQAVHVVCAANRSDEGAGSVDLPPPAANRLIHIDWQKPQISDWGRGLLEGWNVIAPRLVALPDNWRRRPEVRRARELVAAFLSDKQNYMLDFPAGETEQGQAWPSPRSWEIAAEALGAALVVDAPRLVKLRLMSGAVGTIPTAKFFEWYDKDWEDPLTFGKFSREAKELPKSFFREFTPSKTYAMSLQLVDTVRKKPSAEEWEHVWGSLVSAAKKVEHPAALSVAAGRMLEMLEDPKMKKKLKGVEMPMEKDVDLFRVEGVTEF